MAQEGAPARGKTSGANKTGSGDDGGNKKAGSRSDGPARGADGDGGDGGVVAGNGVYDPKIGAQAPSSSVAVGREPDKTKDAAPRWGQSSCTCWPGIPWKARRHRNLSIVHAICCRAVQRR